MTGRIEPTFWPLEERRIDVTGAYCVYFFSRQHNSNARHQNTHATNVINLWITQIGMPVRLIVLAIAGVMIAALANHVIHRWCLFGQRLVGPWGEKHSDALPGMFLDRVPIVGWWLMRRDVAVHGSGFWIRPMLIEFAMAFAVPGLYWFETQTGLLLPAGIRGPANLAKLEPWFTQMFFFHLILLGLMVAATFIDFDERTIPDIITIPGTLIALLLASFSVWWFLPSPQTLANFGFKVFPTTMEVPYDLNAVVLGMAAKWYGALGLWTGLGIWSAWCFALADRRLILRKGVAKAVEFFLAGLVRHSSWKFLAAMWVVGLIAIRVVWGWGGTHWHGLLTALVGLAVGGGIVWLIRIVASMAMNVEAMGFGDVTLMAMIGAFIGWQASMIAFFLAPMAAIAIVLVVYIVTRDNQLPFGPYLCAGTLLTIFFWDRLWTNWLMPNLQLIGPFLIWMGLVIVGLMGVMLFIWRFIKLAMFAAESGRQDEPV